MRNPPSCRALRVSAWLYRLLLAAYPAAFRREYGEPMIQLFRDCCAREFSEAGYLGLARLWFRTLGDVASTAIREHLARDGIRRSVSAGDAFPLTPRARRSLAIALREADAAGRRQVAPEHIVLGLLGEGGGVAGCVLRDMAVSVCRARAVAAALRRDPRASGGEFVSALIQDAEAEAHRLGHSYVGTEHLLLGLLKEQKPALGAFFDSLGVTVEQVQRGTLRVIGAPNN